MYTSTFVKVCFKGYPKRAKIGKKNIGKNS